MANAKRLPLRLMHWFCESARAAPRRFISLVPSYVGNAAVIINAYGFVKIPWLGYLLCLFGTPSPKV